jgi:hypothetical protein
MIRRLMALADTVAALLLMTAPARALDLGGTWSSNTTVSSDCTTQTSLFKIADGVTLTVTNTTIMVTGNYFWYGTNATATLPGYSGTLNNYGTFDYTGWTGGRLIQIGATNGPTINNFGTFKFGALSSAIRLCQNSGYGALYNAGTFLVDAVVGTYAGLSQGALVLIGIKPYRVSYVGGDGNDVVLCTGSDGTISMFR